MLYNLVLRRTSTFTLAVLVSAFVFERGFDLAADKIFDTVNKGVNIHVYFMLILYFIFDVFFICKCHV